MVQIMAFRPQRKRTNFSSLITQNLENREHMILHYAKMLGTCCNPNFLAFTPFNNVYMVLTCMKDIDDNVLKVDHAPITK